MLPHTPGPVATRGRVFLSRRLESMHARTPNAARRHREGWSCDRIGSKIAVSPPILYPTPTMTELGETYSIPQKIRDFSVDLRLDVAGEACRARGDG